MRSIFFGCDASTTRASTALVGVEQIESIFYVRYCRVWEPKKIKGVRIGKKSVDLDATIGVEVERLWRAGNLFEIAVDPYAMHSLIIKWARMGIRVTEIGQTATRYAVDSLLLDILRSGRLRHNGDSMLTQHISGAVLTENVRGVRIAKGKYTKNDAAIALAQAIFICHKRGGGLAKVKMSESPFYSSGGKDVPKHPESSRIRVLKRVIMTSNPRAAHVLMESENAPHNWKTCRLRTKGCERCKAELESLGYFQLGGNDRQKFIDTQLTRGKNHE